MTREGQTQWNIRFSIGRGTDETIISVFAVQIKQTGEKSVEADGVQLHFMERIISIEEFKEAR